MAILCKRQNHIFHVKSTHCHIHSSCFVSFSFSFFCFFHFWSWEIKTHQKIKSHIQLSPIDNLWWWVVNKKQKKTMYFLGTSAKSIIDPQKNRGISFSMISPDIPTNLKKWILSLFHKYNWLYTHWKPPPPPKCIVFHKIQMYTYKYVLDQNNKIFTLCIWQSKQASQVSPLWVSSTHFVHIHNFFKIQFSWIKKLKSETIENHWQNLTTRLGKRYVCIPPPQWCNFYKLSIFSKIWQSEFSH